MAKRRQPVAWPEHLAARLARCREAVAKKRLDGYLITDRMDQFHLTGFTGEDGAVLVTARRVVLITDGRFAQTAQIEAPWTRAVIRKGPLPPAVARCLRQAKLERVGVDPGRIPLALFTVVRKAARPTTTGPSGWGRRLSYLDCSSFCHVRLTE